ncbi:BQ2448_3345 [Microbotryum intermedium]|uniref:BQ2448_3345 protein n=1 Tax=Microbotryum intermedium TaxID=269621 RepID=A0A238FF10_9BASI|nr:BQ2448_3345 [Microbotryum intermedium]
MSCYTELVSRVSMMKEAMSLCRRGSGNRKVDTARTIEWRLPLSDRASNSLLLSLPITSCNPFPSPFLRSVPGSPPRYHPHFLPTSQLLPKTTTPHSARAPLRNRVKRASAELPEPNFPPPPTRPMATIAPLLPPLPSTSKQPLSAGWHLASGAISGAASVLALQPLDLIKTRLQQESQQRGVTAGSTTSIVGSSKHSVIGPSSNGPTATSATATSVTASATPTIPKASPATLVLGKPIPNVASTPNRAKILTTARAVVAQEGVVGLWRGTVPTLYRNVPGVSLYFLTLSRLRNLIGSFPMFRPTNLTSTSPGGKIKLTTTGDLLVGSTARTGVGFILMPATLLKTLSESSIIAKPNQPRPTSLQILSNLYRTGGLTSLWRGAVPTALRDAPGAGLFIVFYERGRRLLGVRAEGAAGGGLAGASASLFSTLLTTPFDLLKTRRQLSPEVYTTLWASARKVWELNGLKGFWQGGALRVVRKAGSAGIGWAVYEGVVGFGEKRGLEGVKKVASG